MGLRMAFFWHRRARRMGPAVFGTLLVGLAAPALATEDRLIPPLVVFGEVGDGLWAYGQLDKGLLVYDDGDTALAYPLVDNANASTRLGFWLRGDVTNWLNARANVEGEWTPYSTDQVNRTNRSDLNLDSTKLRKLELILEADRIGTLWLGQGSMASDGTSEVDLSGTDVVAYASVSDLAGGQLFVLDDDTVSDVSVVDAFTDYDGLGRRVRLRYDTPLWQGFGLRASGGRDRLDDGKNAALEWDLAATYNRETERLEIASALAFSRPDGDLERLNGSLSTVHKASGLNFTIAGGATERVGSANGAFLYGKLGWRAELTDAGKTSFSVDLYSGDDVESVGSESLSVGLAAVQAVPGWQTDFYAGFRLYDLEDDTADYKTGLALLTGARFRF